MSLVLHSVMTGSIFVFIASEGIRRSYEQSVVLLQHSHDHYVTKQYHTAEELKTRQIEIHPKMFKMVVPHTHFVRRHSKNDRIPFSKFSYFTKILGSPFPDSVQRVLSTCPYGRKKMKILIKK
jgi:hypothetical protein